MDHNLDMNVTELGEQYLQFPTEFLLKDRRTEVGWNLTVLPQAWDLSGGTEHLFLDSTSRAVGESVVEVDQHKHPLVS